MKIAFIASLYEKEIHQFHYLAIIELLENLGHSVSHEHITQFTIEQINQSEETNTQFHQKVFRAIKSAELVVAEISKQSLGVGYTIAKALKKEKPVLALTAADTPPLTTFLENQSSAELIVHQYSKIRELEKELPFLLSQVEPKKETKFNFFLPLKLNSYLLKAAHRQRLSKSEYLRRLLENDQKQPL